MGCLQRPVRCGKRQIGKKRTVSAAVLAQIFDHTRCIEVARIGADGKQRSMRMLSVSRGSQRGGVVLTSAIVVSTTLQQNERPIETACRRLQFRGVAKMLLSGHICAIACVREHISNGRDVWFQVAFIAGLPLQKMQSLQCFRHGAHTNPMIILPRQQHGS